MSDLGVTAGSSIWLRDAVGHDVGPELTRDEAGAVTAKIKSFVGVTCLLIYEAQRRKAHKALGYATWVEYVGAEFDISKSRSYQLISQAQFIIDLADETSTIVDVSEYEVRELAPHRDEVVAAVADAVDALPPDATDVDRSTAARSAIEDVKASLAEQAGPPDDPATVPTGDTQPSGEVADESEGSSATTPPPATSPVPSKAPAVKLHALLSEHRAQVAKWLAFDSHEQVIDAMTSEQRADYRSFVLSVFTHANTTIDYLDAPARLKAVN